MTPENGYIKKTRRVECLFLTLSGNIIIMDAATANMILAQMEIMRERISALEDGEYMPSRKHKRSRSSASEADTADVSPTVKGIVEGFLAKYGEIMAMFGMRVKVTGSFKNLNAEAGGLATMNAAWLDNRRARVYFTIEKEMRCPLGGDHVIVPGGKEIKDVCSQLWMAPAKFGKGNFIIACASHKGFKCLASKEVNGVATPVGFIMANPIKLADL